ncbi:MAG: biotin transporter BioY [Bacilli bacterium]|nr:biotin transporter BioY [Bacilli bacterium]
MKKKVVYSITMAATFAAIITVCSWISIPVLVVPFTLQTLAIFLCCWTLDFKTSMFAITAYLLLGLVGVPVFSGFSGGVSAILGPTGGYLVGFLFMPPVYYLISRLGKDTLPFRIIGLLASLVVCYLFGSVWFYFVYMGKGTTVGFNQVLSWCVIPFIGPDLVKGLFAVLLGERLLKSTPLGKYKFAKKSQPVAQ